MSSSRHATQAPLSAVEIQGAEVPFLLHTCFFFFLRRMCICRAVGVFSDHPLLELWLGCETSFQSIGTCYPLICPMVTPSGKFANVITVVAIAKAEVQHALKRCSKAFKKPLQVRVRNRTEPYCCDNLVVGARKPERVQQNPDNMLHLCPFGVTIVQIEGWQVCPPNIPLKPRSGGAHPQKAQKNKGVPPSRDLPHWLVSFLFPVTCQPQGVCHFETLR